MLKWEPGPVADWDVWNGWHENVLKSTGFKKKSRQELEKYEALENFPTEVQNCIKESIGYYMFLKSQKLKSRRTRFQLNRLFLLLYCIYKYTCV